MKTNPLLRMDRGFSLVEMMIGLTITMVVVGAFINLLINQNKSYSSESLRQEMNISGRVAMDEIQREAMNVGTGLPGLFPAIQIRDGGSSEPDTITFIYVPQTNIYLEFSSSPKPNASANSMKFSAASNVDSIAVGDHLIIYDESDFNIIEVTSVNIPSGTAVFVPPAGVNTPSGLAKAYDPPTTVITRVSVTSMTVDKTDSDHPQLIKFKGSNVLGSIAYDIENLQVLLYFEDGDTASVADTTDGDTTNDPMDLDAVEVTVTARSSRADTERNQEGDHFWRQEFTAMVAPRNLIY